MKRKSKIAVNPWGAEDRLITGKETFEQAVELIAKMGVDGIDMQEYYTGFDPHANIYDVHQKRKFIQAMGLEVLSCWHYSDLLGCCALYSIEHAVARIREYIAVAAAYESPYLVIANGNLPAGMSENQGSDILLKAYDMIALTAEEYGIIVTFECARSTTPFQSPQGGLELVKRHGSPNLGICPDFEAWRRQIEGRPITYVENPDASQPEPVPLQVFQDCLPYAPYIHAKLLEFDSEGEDPNYPVAELMGMAVADTQPHDFCMEYEGWLPSLYPEKNAWDEMKKGVSLLKQFL